MTLTTVHYGRYSTSPESATGTLDADDSLATVYDALAQHTWFVSGGFVGGKAGSPNASARLSVYQADSSKNPATRVGYMSPTTVSTVMVGGGDGTLYTANVSGSDNGPTNAAIMGFAGRRYAIDLIAGGADMRFSMVAAADVSQDNEQFYRRTSPSNPPPTNYGAYVASVEGAATFFLTGYQNTAPLAPNNRTPSGTINDTAPTFAADFRDLCGAYGVSSGDGLDLGDRANQIQIQLRATGTTALLWDTTLDATGTEQATDHIGRAYGGSSLTRGTTYEWRIRTSDEFAEWGDWSTWLSFTPANLGFVTTDGNPTGKSDDNTPDFDGKWTHQAAKSMTHVQVRVLAADGATVLQTGTVYDIADVSSSASPGTAFTVAWANTGLSALQWGRAYTYQLQGQDADGIWSDWSAVRSFSTDAAPTIPAALSPAGGTIFTSLPKLSASFSDSDDTTATGLTGVFRITRPDTTTVDATPTYNATTGKWEFQTTATELSAFGTYSWKAIGYDGTLYSGGFTSLGNGVWSSGATFDYESGPVIAVSSPTDGDTITAATLTVSWSVTSGGPQTKYEVLVYPDGGTTPVYDSGLLTSTATSHAIPPGFLRNATAYDLIVRVQNATPLDGYSNLINLTVAFTPPDAPANFQVNPASIGLDPFPTVNRLTWDRTAYAAPDFDHIAIYRSADGGPDAAEILLARITSPSVTQFVDYTPASGYTYSYALTVSTVTGSDTVESDRETATGSVVLAGTVLTLLGNGGTYRACLLNCTDRSFDRQIQEAVYQSPASTKPVTVRAATRYYQGTYAGTIAGDATASAQQRWDELDALDAQQGTVCIRDGRGRKTFAKIVSLKPTDLKPDLVSYALTTRDESASEGVA